MYLWKKKGLVLQCMPHLPIDKLIEQRVYMLNSGYTVHKPWETIRKQSGEPKDSFSSVPNILAFFDHLVNSKGKAKEGKWLTPPHKDI
eukprot:3261076-Amphidinium_carterae.1